MPRTTAPVAPPAGGTVLAGRYRLVRPCLPGREHTWRAFDEVLCRPVAIRLLALRARGRAGPTSDRLLAEAARAGRTVDPRLARLLDVGTGRGPDGRFGFLVSEWVDAPDLVSVLHDGPLPAAEAVDVVFRTAEALSRASAAGTGHGRVQPGNVHVGPTGEVKVTDLGVAAVAADRPVDPAADATGLAGLLYACLTGYWPWPDPVVRLPPAPRRSGRPCRPRQIRAGVSRDLDELSMWLLDGGADSPQQVAGLLAPLPRRPRRADDEPADEETTPRLRSRRRVWLIRLLPVTGLAGVCAACYLVGTAVGRLPGPQHQIPSFSPPSPAVAPVPLAAVPVATVRVYEPAGAGSDNPSAAALAVDGDPSTAWYTDYYHGNPVFGGGKQGVGLLLDLGRPVLLRAVRVALTTPGADLQLRAGDSPGLTGSDRSVVAARDDAPQTFTLVPSAARPARYWLLWLTRLPPVGGDAYREGIAEIACYR